MAEQSPGKKRKREQEHNTEEVRELKRHKGNREIAKSDEDRHEVNAR